VFYKVDAIYSADHDAGVNWLDPAFDIPWPVDTSKAILSDKGKALPTMTALPAYFESDISMRILITGLPRPLLN
jgi:dTDP-4-dehydrorhamnose 3,5-epimerase